MSDLKAMLHTLSALDEPRSHMTRAQALANVDRMYPAIRYGIEECQRHIAAMTVPCTFCDGTGNVRISRDPQDDRDCSVCQGAGELTQAELDNAETEAAAYDPDAKGDWEYHQER